MRTARRRDGGTAGVPTTIRRVPGRGAAQVRQPKIAAGELLRFERNAAQRPDLILGVYTGMTDALGLGGACILFMQNPPTIAPRRADDGSLPARSARRRASMRVMSTLRADQWCDDAREAQSSNVRVGVRRGSRWMSTSSRSASTIQWSATPEAA